MTFSCFPDEERFVVCGFKTMPFRFASFAGTALLVAAMFFGYMFALLVRRIRSLFSSSRHVSESVWFGFELRVKPQCEPV